MRKTNRIHRAWIVLAGCTLMFFTITGITGNNFPVFTPFIMKQFGYSKTKISIITSSASLSSVLAVFCTASYYRKISLRNGMLLAGGLSVLSYVILGTAEAYPLFLLGSICKGFAYGLGSMVPISMILEKWFRSKLTLCLSIVSAASGLATIGIPSLITQAIQKLGLHYAFYISAAVLAVLYLISWLLIRNDPTEVGEVPYQEEKPEKSGTAQAETVLSAKNRPVRYLPPRLWNLLYVSVLAATCATTCFSTLSLLSTTEGYTPETAAVIVSVSGAALMIGKLSFGALSTLIGLRRTSLLFGSFSFCGLILCTLTPHGVFFLASGTALLGLSLSTLTIGTVAWVQDWSPPEDRADHIKNFQTMYNLGCLANGLLAGVVADLAGGSYLPFYGMAAFVSLYFVIIIYAAYRKQKQLQR